MSYSTSTYLVHFNKNHSSKDGKFTYGDGDGDGIIDDHRNGRKGQSGSSSRSSGSSKSTSKSGLKTKSNKVTQEQVDSWYINGKRVIGNSKLQGRTNSQLMGHGAALTVAGAGGIVVGKLLENSGNLVAAGAGFVAETAGWFAVGYGTTEFGIGAAYEIHDRKQNK